MREKKSLKRRKHPSVPHDRNANFCTLCGAKIHAPFTCNHCGGTQLDVRGNFCINCGRSKTPEEPCCESYKKKTSEFGVDLCPTCWGNRMRS